MWPNHAPRWPSSSRGEDDGDDGGGDDGDGDDGDVDGHDVDGGQPLSPEKTVNVILVGDTKPLAQILFSRNYPNTLSPCLTKILIFYMFPSGDAVHLGKGKPISAETNWHQTRG